MNDGDDSFAAASFMEPIAFLTLIHFYDSIWQLEKPFF